MFIVAVIRNVISTEYTVLGVLCEVKKRLLGDHVLLSVCDLFSLAKPFVGFS